MLFSNKNILLKRHSNIATMFSINYITSIPVFRGKQSNYYLLNDIKYCTRFPIEWAMNHLTFEIDDNDKYETGPNNCENCITYGCIRGVFVGYCDKCLHYYLTHAGECRGNMSLVDVGVNNMSVRALWQKYNYLTGLTHAEIGDEDLEDGNLEDGNLDDNNNEFIDWTHLQANPSAICCFSDDEEEEQNEME